MNLLKRFHLLLKVLPVLAVLVLIKAAVHWSGLEFITIDGLIPSLIAGAIFLIGFLLSHVVADFKDAERMPGEMRGALEAIHDDVTAFTRTQPTVDLAALRKLLGDIVLDLQTCLGRAGGHSDLSRVIARVDELSAYFIDLERLGLSERYVVRLRSSQDILRRSLFRIFYIQRMEFVPSAHVLVQTLVASCLFLLVFLKTADAWESLLTLGFVGYLFVYAVFLIEFLEQPFRQGEASLDDVSIFILRDFVTKLAAL
jgi:hypothetical protein